MHRDLTRRALKALLHGRHAHLGGGTAANRSKQLVEIACAYTREELLKEPGVGNATATEIELWLKDRGAALRPSAQSRDSSGLERGDEDAYQANGGAYKS